MRTAQSTSESGGGSGVRESRARERWSMATAVTLSSPTAFSSRRSFSRVSARSCRR